MKDIWRRIKDFPVVSFDVFDTLIKRNVPHPKDIFDIVESRYNRLNDAPITGFREARVLAERQARTQTDAEEVDIGQIYENLSYESETRESLKQIEIETELAYCCTNYEMLDVFMKCVDSHKRIFIISDMYLPKETIACMLDKCGYKGYERLYVSSDIRLQKVNGSLYDFVLKDAGIMNREMVHIGDSRRSDYIMPRTKGIKSIHIDRNTVNCNFLTKKDIWENTGKQGILFSFLNNELAGYKKESEFFRWGYEALGPLILGFCTWIHAQIEENGIKKAFFLARDMYLVKNIYQMLYDDVEIVYLEVSRRSLREAYIKKKNDIRAVFDTMGRKKYTLEDILNILSINTEDSKKIEKCLAKKEIEITDCAIENLDEETLGLVNSIILDSLNSKNDNTLEYLLQMGVMGKDKSALIDIGWHGTIQNMLEQLTDKSFHGLYFGNTKRKEYKNMESDGYWFSEENEKNALEYLSMICILEVMLFPQIGTTLGYLFDNGVYKPIYGSTEMPEDVVVNEFQRGTWKFVKDIAGYLKDIEVIRADQAVAAYRRLTYQPTFHQAEIISGLLYEDGATNRLAEVRPWLNYLIKPSAITNDYARARWKEGFIKQIMPIVKNPGLIDHLLKKRHLLGRS